jgi:uncharacterized protein YndB with AHSA1/START domain
MASRSDSSEIRITRVYEAPLRTVWDAWTVPEQVAAWWGPRGFTLTTHSKELRAGGTWRYTMHGPDGVDYPNVTRYLVVEPLKKLVYDHGGTDERPPLFRVTVTFSESHGKTRMDMVSSLPSPEAAREMTKFIKQAGGNATWDRLAEHLAQTASGQPIFVINRTFDAPIARVFEMWADPAQLAKWLPPPGTRMHFVRSEIATGTSTLFVITGQHVTMHVRAHYLAVEAPHSLIYTQQFVDEHEQPALPPGTSTWPRQLLTTVLLSEEAPDRTRVTVTSQPHGEATAAELEAFLTERAGMTLGWSASFDTLESLCEGPQAQRP